jgi:hypothetical protein
VPPQYAIQIDHVRTRDFTNGHALPVLLDHTLLTLEPLASPKLGSLSFFFSGHAGCIGM